MIRLCKIPSFGLLCGALLAIATVPTPRALQPMVPVSLHPVEDALAAPTVDDGTGPRAAGIVLVLAKPEFNTGIIKAIDTNAELMRDPPPDQFGIRSLIVRTNDEGIDRLVDALSLEPAVAAASKSFIRYTHGSAPNDPYWGGQSNAGLGWLNIPALWDVSRGSSEVAVAVIDGGVNEIPDLAGRVGGGRNFLLDQPGGDTLDEDGHGTAVASIIAASANNGRDIAGIAPGVRIVPVKACHPFGGIQGFESCDDVVLGDALQWVAGEAINGRIRVVNMSLGGKTSTSAEAFWLQTLRQMNVPVVASAGNDGTPNILYPAKSPDAIAVGGTLPNLARRTESNYGPELDVAAPFQTYAMNNIDAPFYAEGTSFSAPVIAGLLALSISSDMQLPQFVGTGMGHYPTWWVNHTCSGWNEETGCGVPTSWLGIMLSWAKTRFDFNRDCVIDVTDEQIIAVHYATVFGQPGYDLKYDLEPTAGDLDVDIRDLQKIFGRDGFVCNVGG